MQNLKHLKLAITILVFVCASVGAQPPRGGERGGGERGGGERGGGERGGGDRGGGQRGGGERGGGGRGGGDRGGGERGGFDPSAMLRRLDRNGDGVLSPDETEGRARGFIERFVPGVDLSKPISIEKLAKGVQKAREDREKANAEPSDVEGPEPLVPGFDVLVDFPPVLGFGVSEEFFDVEITDKDREEAKEDMRRNDRNRDGMLDRAEVRRGRWSDDPWQYDQNKDGNLTERELTTREAIRRTAQEDERERRDRRRDNDDDRDEKEDKKKPNKDDRSSYRFATAHERLPKATPDWFLEKDLNKDGQVMMFEYATKWDNDTAGEFDKWDLNRDGVIVPREAITGSDDVAATDSSNDKSNEDAQATSKPKPQKIDDEKRERYRKYATSVVKKYDKNGDGQLSADEYSKMRRPPDDADRDGNKRITIDELTEFTLRK